MVKPKPDYRWREGDQVPTCPTTVRQIMNGPSFTLGVADARAGRPYHRDYDLWDTNTQWVYERGRAWAMLAPHHVKLRQNSEITPEAIAWYGSDII
jgi:hypothetical protein